MRRALYREHGARFIVDVLLDEETVRDDGELWRTARVRLVRIVRQSPIKELSVGHVWTCDAKVSASAYVGWHLFYTPDPTELEGVSLDS